LQRDEGVALGGLLEGGVTTVRAGDRQAEELLADRRAPSGLHVRPVAEGDDTADDRHEEVHETASTAREDHDRAQDPHGDTNDEAVDDAGAETREQFPRGAGTEIRIRAGESRAAEPTVLRRPVLGCTVLRSAELGRTELGRSVLRGSVLR